MRYFARLRLEWIADMLKVYGFINREHQMRKFGVTMAQAAVDFRMFQELNPLAMHYDRSAKRYVAGPQPPSDLVL